MLDSKYIVKEKEEWTKLGDEPSFVQALAKNIYQG